MIHNNLFDLVGRTPCVSVRDAEASLYLKLEGANPTGSVKDRACAFMLSAAAGDGTLRPGQIVLDASSGNFACALALFGRALGHDAAVAVTSKITAAKRDFLACVGATVHAVGDFTIEANRYCRELDAAHPGRYFFVDQLHNWNNPRAHERSTGPEILETVPDVTMVVGSLGSGGTMAGVAAYFDAAAPHVRIVAVTCAPGNRIPGTGSFADGDYVTPFIARARDCGHIDRTVEVTEREAACEAHALMRQGLFCGLQTGAVVHAARLCAREERLTGPVVAISGDAGWKNMDKLLPLWR